MTKQSVADDERCVANEEECVENDKLCNNFAPKLIHGRAKHVNMSSDELLDISFLTVLFLKIEKQN